MKLRKRLCVAWATILVLAGASAPPALAQAALGLKHTVGVDAFGGGELTEGAASPDSLNALLTDALISDGHFIVVERAGLGSVQTEQQLGTTGMATAATAAKTNQMIGAGLLVRGAVIKFSSAAGGGGLTLGGSFGGGLLGAGGGAKTNKAVMTVSLRLIDTTTGQVLATATGEGSATSKEVNAGLTNNRTGATLGTNAFKATPVGKAAEVAIDQAVGKLAAGLGNVPWSALVVDDRAGVVYINAGADQNVQPGLTLGVDRKGETLTDPGTGAVLDVQMTRIGTIQIDAVREKISTAHIVSGGAPVRGDMLRVD